LAVALKINSDDGGLKSESEVNEQEKSFWKRVMKEDHRPLAGFLKMSSVIFLCFPITHRISQKLHANNPFRRNFPSAESDDELMFSLVQFDLLPPPDAEMAKRRAHQGSFSRFCA
jgi:hypothetical protein